jgi:glucoamylase
VTATAEHHIAPGDRAAAARLADAMRRFASGFGLIPEQGWENPDLAASPFGTPPEEASIGFVNGKPVGSASPLTWSAAQYVRLVRDIAAGRLLEQPANTTRRYVTNRQQATTLTVTEPPDRTPVTASPVTVRGTSAPGNTVDVSATNIDAECANTVVTTTAAADGSWSAEVPVEGGRTTLDAGRVPVRGARLHGHPAGDHPGRVHRRLIQPSGSSWSRPPERSRRASRTASRVR